MERRQGPLLDLVGRKRLDGGRSMPVVVAVEGMLGMLLDMVGMVGRGLLARGYLREVFQPGQDKMVDGRGHMDPDR